MRIALRRIYQRCIRWKYVILTLNDYTARLNRSVEVETVLFNCAAGKREMLSRQECRELAVKLGTPIKKQ